MKKNTNPISIKFILFLFVVIVALITYLSLPKDSKTIKKEIPFEETLENKNIRDNDTTEDVTQDYEDDLIPIQEFSQDEEQSLLPPPSTEMIPKEVKKPINRAKSSSKIKRSNVEYNALLDELASYPAKNQRAVQIIVNKLLKNKNYPENTVKAIAKDIDQSKAKTHENYMVANFDFSSGNLNISPKMLFELDNKELIAILAHELDHFDKLANTCKSMGIDKYQALFNENEIKIDTAFWSRAAALANDESFNASLYQDAVKRFITQNNLELTSSYSDFYKLAENMRNPLEVSAYKQSDYVYGYYKIKITDGPIKRLTKKFNDVDWAIYDFISKNPELKNQRIAIFDYYFSQAIISKLPQFASEYNKCVNDKDGDLTSFWMAYENSVSSFYHRGSMMSENTYNTIYSILEETERKAQTPLTKQEVIKAFKFKINTLLANLVYPKAVKNLRSTIIEYLKYIKKEGIQDTEQEFKCILTLICIDNKLTTKNKNEEIKLYYLKIPEEFSELYNIDITKKNNKFLFLYNNPAFINKRSVAISEQNALIDMLNANRLDIRIKN